MINEKRESQISFLTCVDGKSRARTQFVPSHPQYGLKGPVSVSGCCTSAFCYADRLERPRYGSRSRSRTGFTGRDIRDLGACLRHHTTD